MKSLHKKLLLLVMFFASSLVWASTNLDDHDVDVRFAHGADAADYQGRIIGLSEHRYSFIAKKGQVLTVNTEGSDQGITVFLSFPGVIQNEQQTGKERVLPKSGRYTIQVIQSRESARQDNNPYYFLNIRIVDKKPAASASKEIRFARGENHVLISGKLRGSDVKKYRFTAKEGQVLRVDAEKSNPNIITVLKYLGTGVNDDELLTIEQILPKDGTYELWVLQTRNGVRKGNDWRHYRLDVSIKDE